VAQVIQSMAADSRHRHEDPLIEFATSFKQSRPASSSFPDRLEWPDRSEQHLRLMHTGAPQNDGGLFQCSSRQGRLGERG